VARDATPDVRVAFAVAQVTLGGGPATLPNPAREGIERGEGVSGRRGQLVGSRGRRRGGARGLRRLLVVVLVAGVAGALVAPQVAQGATPLGPRVGVSAGHMVLWESDAQRLADLNAIKASGATWFGMDFDWASIQPARNVWRWATTDKVVRQARARGLQIVATLAYSPRWAVPASCPAGTTHCFPANPADFARFAKKAVLRYGIKSRIARFRGSVRTWQIWNEANHYPFVMPVVNVGAYTQMLKGAYTAIKSADSWTRVLAGGTSPAPDDPGGKDMSPVKFLQGIYAYGGRGYFDAFSHHPYSFPCNPLVEAPWNAFYQSAAIYFTMSLHGDAAKKLWGTEAGAPTGADIGSCTPNSPGVSVTEAVQAQFVRDYLWGWTVKYGAFTGPLIWFQIRNNGTNAWSPDDNFGLIRRNYTAKPAFSVFASLMRGS
jgi:hypothetical protein